MQESGSYKFVTTITGLFFSEPRSFFPNFKIISDNIYSKYNVKTGFFREKTGCVFWGKGRFCKGIFYCW
jgi:hypothetical protein